jgi:hypothetical protein
MRADRVEVSWDMNKKKWLVRITVGEEVIRPACGEAVVHAALDCN